MISGIFKSNGKKPLEDESTRKYYPVGEPIPNWNGDECGKLKDGFIAIDIDDYDNNEQIVNPIKGEPRSKIIKNILDEQKIKYNLLQTSRGVHFYFRFPDGAFEKKGYVNWQTPISIQAEFHPGEGTRKFHIPYKMNGTERMWIIGNMLNEDIDVLPYWLFPLQKSLNKPFDLNFPNGDRTQKLGAYLFHLIKINYSAEQAFEIVHIMNQYIFENPIDSRTLEAEILNESTMQKLKEWENEKSEKNISHSKIAQTIIDEFDIITVNKQFYSYISGVYKAFDDDKITQYMTTFHPKLNGNFEKEVFRQIRGRSYTEPPDDDGTVNIKNGVLKFDDDGNVTILPHSKDHISFKQFNANYNPKAQCKLLDDCLMTWFNGDNEQIELFNQMLGYLMMNHVNYQKIFFFVGAPATGKNTLLT